MTFVMKEGSCSYCCRRRKLFMCSMLSAHCKECCVGECGGQKKVNHIDEAMKLAREMGGASWPSADCTRWALANLAARISEFVGQAYRPGMDRKELSNLILYSCGLKDKKGS